MTKRKAVDFGIKNDQTTQNYESITPSQDDKKIFEWKGAYCKDGHKICYNCGFCEPLCKCLKPKQKGKVEETEEVALKIKQEVLKEVYEELPDITIGDFVRNAKYPSKATGFLLGKAIDLAISKTLKEVFAEIDKIIATPENPVTFLAGEEAALLHMFDYQKLKKHFGVDVGKKEVK